MLDPKWLCAIKSCSTDITFAPVARCVFECVWWCVVVVLLWWWIGGGVAVVWRWCGGGVAVVWWVLVTLSPTSDCFASAAMRSLFGCHRLVLSSPLTASYNCFVCFALLAGGHINALHYGDESHAVRGYRLFSSAHVHTEESQW